MTAAACLAVLLAASSPALAQDGEVRPATERARAASATPAANADRLPVSISRIRRELRSTPRSHLILSLPPDPVATFRSQAVLHYLPPFKQRFDDAVGPTPAQRQAERWGRQPTVDLGRVAHGIRSAIDEYRARRIRAEIARELGTGQ